MNKVIQLVLISLLSVSFTQTQVEEAGLKGNVKSVLTKEEASWFEGEARAIREQFYSEDGYLRESSYYSYSFSDGSVRFKATTSYTDQGQEVARLDIAPDDSVVGSIIYRYNADGLLEEKITFDADNEISKEERFEYNSAAKQINWLTLKDGAVIRSMQTEYDEAGQKLKRSSYDATGRLTRETLYKENGQLAEDYDYDDDGTIECLSSIYDDKDIIQSRGRCDDSEEAYSVSYSYDENDLEIKREEVIGANSNVYTSTYTTFYEFDEQGNWIKKTIEEETGTGFKSISQILYRTIEYY